jgi:uroporphyrinogen decarboxylase
VNTTPKERAYAALERREPERIPLFEAWVDPVIVEKVVGCPVRGVREIIDFYTKLELDFVPIPPANSPNRHMGEVILDEWGIKWQPRGEGRLSELGFYIDGTLKTSEDFDNFEFPNPLAPSRLEAFAHAVKEVGDEYAVTAVIDQPVFERAALQVGMANFLRCMYTDPTFVKNVLNKNYQYNLELAKAYLDAGAEFFIIADDIADNHGPLMSPSLYKNFLDLYYRNLVGTLKKRGAKVLFHSDGYLTPIIGYILDWGIDGLHPFQTGVMDISRFKKEYGDRMAVVGGVDVGKLLPLGTQEEVEESVLDVIKKVGPGGGFVLGSSNSLHSYIPDLEKYVKNILKYIDTAHRFGIYPIS